jgi:integrase
MQLPAILYPGSRCTAHLRSGASEVHSEANPSDAPPTDDSYVPLPDPSTCSTSVCRIAIFDHPYRPAVTWTAGLSIRSLARSWSLNRETNLERQQSFAINRKEPPRAASNKGKLTGPKPPLRPGHVWSIRARLQPEKHTRDLALFNLAIDSKLRGCDLVDLRVDDVAPNGYSVDRATVRQTKTGRPVRFELTEVTRQALDNYLRVGGRKLGQCLFPGRHGPDRHLTTRQYARLTTAIGPISSC